MFAFFELILLLLLLIIAWLLALIDILKHEFTGDNKLIWTLVVIFIPVVGSIVYFFVGRNQRLNT